MCHYHSPGISPNNIACISLETRRLQTQQTGAFRHRPYRVHFPLPLFNGDSYRPDLTAQLVGSSFFLREHAATPPARDRNSFVVHHVSIKRRAAISAFSAATISHSCAVFQISRSSNPGIASPTENDGLDPHTCDERSL